VVMLDEGQLAGCFLADLGEAEPSLLHAWASPLLRQQGLLQVYYFCTARQHRGHGVVLCELAVLLARQVGMGAVRCHSISKVAPT
jgi:hypothetical protein